MKGNYETIVHPLKPLYDEDSKILILGSFPSVKTREYGFFYGHPQNRFWKLMERLFDVDLDVSIEERKRFLLEHNIAVYDSIYQCDIIGSSDSSIKNVVPSNLKGIVDCADINHVGVITAGMVLAFTNLMNGVLQPIASLPQMQLKTNTTKMVILQQMRQKK